MGQIEDLRLFALVVESGSISKAADGLSIAKSAVSRRLALLEERYEKKLVDRRPGTWKVTETGLELYQRAVRAIGEVDDIDADFVSASADLSGPLSISVPRDFGLSYLGDVLIAFKIRFPEITLAVDFDDRVVDLARENYDFVLRITGTAESDISASRIGRVEHALYASPFYLSSRSTPQSIDDLQDHPLLYYGSARRTVWDFVSRKGKPLNLEFQPFLNSNSGLFLLDATLKGLGIGRLPDFIAKDALHSGMLVRILPEIAIPSWGIYLIHAENRRLNKRMRLFSEEMKKACLR
ncbi:MAG: LysR family transcriptional regulator [Geminicoccales bacterium]